MNLSYYKGKIRADFDFDYNELAKIKTVPQRKYKDLKIGNFWLVPLYQFEMMLKLFPYATIEEPLPMLFELLRKAKAISRKIQTDSTVLFDHDDLKLKKQQEVTIEFIEVLKGCAIIADSMRSGKTAASLVFTSRHLAAKPCLILCPSSVAVNWVNEVKNWLNEDAYLIKGQTTSELPKSNYYVLPYSIMKYWIPELKDKVNCVISDEFHTVKNRKANKKDPFKSGKGVHLKNICKNVEYKIFLSGTPIENRVDDIFAALNIVYPDIFSSYVEFAKYFAGYKPNNFGYWVCSGLQNEKVLKEVLEYFVLRRTLEDIYDYKVKIEKVYFDIERASYNEELERISKWQLENKKFTRMEYLAETARLRQITVSEKYSKCVNFIKETLQENEPCVIFCEHKIVVNNLIETFPNSVKITGNESAKQKAENRDKFQAGEVQFVIANIKAASTGLDLSRANKLFFMELAWTHSVLAQASDRIFNMNDLNHDNNKVFYLLAKDSIDDELLNFVDTKKSIMDKVFK